jgi:hypothetical protein
MPKFQPKIDATDCKTNARIAEEGGYCCETFWASYYMNGLFGHSSKDNKYHLWYLNPTMKIDIHYCPWCAKPVPWKEKL